MRLKDCGQRLASEQRTGRREGRVEMGANHHPRKPGVSICTRACQAQRQNATDHSVCTLILLKSCPHHCLSETAPELVNILHRGYCWHISIKRDGRVGASNMA